MKKYKVMLSTKATKLPKTNEECLLAIEPEDYTKEELKSLKEKGYTLLGYISVGSVSDERDYYSKLKKYTLGKLEDWQHERYLNVAVGYVQSWLINRAKQIINMGFDGLWVDNLDVYEYYRSDELYKGIITVLSEYKKLGYVMVNGGSVFISRLVGELSTMHKVQIGAYRVYDNAKRQCDIIKQHGINAIIVEENGLYKVQVGAFINKSNAENKLQSVIEAGFKDAIIATYKHDVEKSAFPNGVTQEEVFSLIKNYSGKGKFGKQSSKESKYYKQCLLVFLEHGIEVFLLEYTKDNSLKEEIAKYCEVNNITGYYISEDVNL